MLPYISDISVVRRPLGRLKTSSATHSLMPETSILVVRGAKNFVILKNIFVSLLLSLSLSIILVSIFYHFEFKSSKFPFFLSIFNLKEEKAKELTLMVKNLDEAQQSGAIREVCYISGTSV